MEHAFSETPIPKDHVEDADWHERKRGELRKIWKEVFARMLEQDPSIDNLRKRIVRQEFAFIDGGLTPRHVPRDSVTHHIAAVERLTQLYRNTGVPLQAIQLEALDELQMERSAERPEEAA